MTTWLLTALLAFVSGGAGHPRQVDRAAERAALLAADSAASAATAARGYVDGFATFLAGDVAYLAEGQNVLRGPGAVRAFLAASPYAGAKASWKAVRGDVSADGTLGYTFGEGSLTRPDGSTGVIRYIAAWKKEGGAWRLAAYLPVTGTAAGAPAPDGWRPPVDNRRRNVHSSGSAAETEGVMQADRDFAALSGVQGVQAAFTTYAAPQAVMVGRAGITYGRQAIHDAFAGSEGTVIEWWPILGGAAGSGDLGFTVGESVFRVKQPDGTERAIYQKYLSIWERQPAGEWRYVADGGNPRPAPAP